jgi:hypothetical protein
MTGFMTALMSVRFLFDSIMIIIRLNKVIQPNNQKFIRNEKGKAEMAPRLALYYFVPCSITISIALK